MPEWPRLTAAEAEVLLRKAGFSASRSDASHRIYAKNGRRVAIPFHNADTLHPKIVRQTLEAIEDTAGIFPPLQRAGEVEF